MRVAAILRVVPHLTVLDLTGYRLGVELDVNVALGALAMMTRLRQLSLAGNDLHRCQPRMLSGAIASLVNLQELALGAFSEQLADTLCALGVLTALTRVSCSGENFGIGAGAQGRQDFKQVWLQYMRSRVGKQPVPQKVVDFLDLC
jgi:hypothetical protein